MNIKKQLENLKKEYAGQVVLKHDTLNGFFKDLENLHTKIGCKRLELLSENEEKTEKQRKFEKDFPEAEYPDVYYRGKANFEEYKKQYTTALQELETDARQGIKDIQDRLQKYLDACYQLDGAKIDENTTRLLNSGVKLSVAEVERLLNTHNQNATMTRILCDYADSKGLESETIGTHKRQLSKAGGKELEQFNLVSEYVTRMFSNDTKWAKIHCDPKHIERVINETIEGNENLIFSADAPEE